MERECDRVQREVEEKYRGVQQQLDRRHKGCGGIGVVGTHPAQEGRGVSQHAVRAPALGLPVSRTAPDVVVET